MKKLAFIGVLALAGCQTTEDLQRSVGNASNFQLCRAVFLAPRDVAQIAIGEAQRRNLDCTPYAQAVFQNQAQADAAANALARQLLAPAPVFAPQTTCQTYRVGNSLESVCR